MSVDNSTSNNTVQAQEQEVEPVSVVAEDAVAFIAAGGDVVTTAGPFGA